MADDDVLRKDRIGEFERQVLEEAGKEEFTWSVARAVLKLYQFYPDLAKEEVVLVALTKALVAFPESFFALALYLVSPEMQRLSAVQLLIELERDLRRARFSEFWLGVRDPDAQKILSRVPNFNDAVRKCIFDSMARTYACVAPDILRKALGFESDDAGWASFQSKHDLKPSAEDPSALEMPQNAENRPRVRRFEEAVKYTDLGGVMTALSH